MSLSAHKIGGPKGIGALWVRDGVKLAEVQTGGGQEFGLRSGTLSPALIAGGSALLPGVIANYRLLPMALTAPVAAMLPWVEMAVGGAMIAGIPGALFAVPLAAFVNVVAVYLGRSRDGVGPPLRPEDVDLIWSTVPRSRRTPA